MLRAGGCPCEQRGGSSPGQRRLRGHLTAPQSLRGGQGEGTAGPVTAVRGRATEHGRHELKREGFRLGAGTSPREDRQAGGRQRDGLPREVGQAPSLGGFKTRLGKALSNLL